MEGDDGMGSEEWEEVMERVLVLNCGMLRMLKMVLIVVVKCWTKSTPKHRKFINWITCNGCSEICQIYRRELFP